MEQIPLVFNKPLNYSRSDLILGVHNQEVYQYLFGAKNFSCDQQQFLIISGPKHVGKSYLSQLFISENNGKILTLSDYTDLEEIEKVAQQGIIILIENIDHLNVHEQKILFSLYNLILLHGKSKLMLTTSVAPTTSKYSLADLGSRLASMPLLRIEEPSLEILEQILFKLFYDKHLQVTMPIIKYIISRVPRNCKAINQLVNNIESEILIKHKNLSIPLVKTILDNTKFS